MGDYKLWVYFPGDTVVREIVTVDRPAAVLTAIPRLLAEHDGCEHIVVTFENTRLFAVDCAGNRLP